MIGDLAVDPSTGRLVATRPRDGTLSIPVDAPEGATIEAIQFGADGHLYAGICGYCDGEFVVVDVDRRRVVDTVRLGAPIRDIALSPDGGTAYVLAHHPRGAAAVVCIDVVRKAIGGVIEVGESATQAVLSNDGAELYVADRDGVAVVCAHTQRVVTRIDLRPLCMAAADDGRLFVADAALRIHKAHSRTVITHDNSKQTRSPSMKREVLIMAGTAATLAAVMVGCSHSDKAVSVGTAGVAPAGAANTKVVVDGKDQDVKGQVACTKAAGTVNIAIGGGSSSGTPTGIGAVLTDATPPVVKSVALGNVNGVTLAVGGTSGKADATKDGSSYKISGTATGVDMANPMAGPVNKSFELDVTCP